MAVPIPIIAQIVKRRRLCAATCEYIIARRPENWDRPRIFRQPYCFELHLAGISDKGFERLYRMPKLSFYTLHRANLSEPKTTAPVLRLSCTIRWLSGGS